MSGAPDDDGDDGGRSLPRPRTWPDRLVYLVTEYKVAVMISGLAAVALLATGRWNLPNLPEWARMFLRGMLATVPALFLGKVLIVDRFMPDPRLKVAVINPRDGVGIDAKRVTNGVWRNRNRGKWQELQPDRGPFDYVVSEFRWDDTEKKLSVEGVNPELTDAVEMIAVDSKIEEIYTTLMDDRHKLIALINTLEAKAVEYDKKQSMAILESIEHGTTYNPQAGVSEIFDKAGIEEDLRDPPDADDTDPRDTDPWNQAREGDRDRLSLTELLELDRREMSETTNGHNND